MPIADPTSGDGRRAARSRPPSAHEGEAGAAAANVASVSWYARGRTTASGEAFDPDGFTFASREMAYGTTVRFCRATACVEARCTDRGPAEWTGRDFDLSRATFAALAPLGAGVVDVSWELV